ncbi:MAG: GNAT family N-acetyltransferase [Vicinamibacterales bacterium]
MEQTTTLIADAVRGLDRLEQPRVDDWRFSLPVLAAGDVVLREVRSTDAPALQSLLTTPEITRYISQPPTTVEGFERFIAASQRLRASGEGACFAITLKGYDTAIGIFQVRQVVPCEDEARQIGGAMDTAEWGFALGSPFWGAGIFEQGATLVMQFAFEHVRVNRLEARCAAKNGRGNRALRKVGAVAEGILRKAFTVGDEQLDQVLYAIVAQDWRERRGTAGAATSAYMH